MLRAIRLDLVKVYELWDMNYCFGDTTKALRDRLWDLNWYVRENQKSLRYAEIDEVIQVCHLSKSCEAHGRLCVKRG